jgi:hypothetical protein
LDALRGNLAWLRHRVGAGGSIMTVVKADAYGHGLRQIAALLMQAGTDIFGVANLNEARDIRAVGRGWPSRLKGWQTQNRMRGDLYAKGLLVSGGIRLTGSALTT